MLINESGFYENKTYFSVGIVYVPADDAVHADQFPLEYY